MTRTHCVGAPRSRCLLGAAALSLVLAACGTSETASGGGGDSASETITVGSANFPESEIISNLYAEVLTEAGFDVQTKPRIGSREAYIPALQDGSINVIPDYTGNLLLFLDPDATATTPEEINDALPPALAAENLAMLEPAEAQDSDAVVVTQETAQQWNLEEIGDLAEYNDELVFGGPPEFKERAVGLPGLKENYGVDPTSFTPISDGGGPATVQALVDGTVNAANIFSTSPAIQENDLVVLEDPKNNFPAQNVVPLIDDSLADDTQLAEALNSVSSTLTTEDLIALNTKVSGAEKMEPQAAARQWLTDEGLL